MYLDICDALVSFPEVWKTSRNFWISISEVIKQKRVQLQFEAHPKYN